MKEYTLKELSCRAVLKSRRADLLMQTLDLAARGWPEDYEEINKLDIEINIITEQLKDI